VKRLALLVLPAALAFSQDAPRLSLEQALALAQVDNTALLRSRSQTIQAHSDLAQARGPLWPTLSVLSDFSRLGPNLAGDRRYNPSSAFKAAYDDQWATTFSARWSVFDGFAARYTSASRQGLEDAAKARESGQELSTSAQVTVAYREVSRQQLLLQVRVEGLQVSQERLVVAHGRASAGTASLLDEQQAQLSDNTDSATLLKQTLSLSQARRQLNWLLGRDPETPFQVEDSIPLPPLPPRDELLREARDHSPSLAEARAREASAAADIKAQRAEFLPTLSIYSNYAFLNQLHDSSPPPNAYWQSLQYGVQLSMPLFEGGKSVAKRRGLEEAYRQSQIAVREAELALARDLAQAYAAAEQAQTNQDLAARNAELAGKTLELALLQYRVGALAGVDLDRIQQSASEARSNAVSARCDAATAQVQLYLLAGRPLP